MPSVHTPLLCHSHHLLSSTTPPPPSTPPPFLLPEKCKWMSIINSHSNKVKHLTGLKHSFSVSMISMYFVNCMN